MEQLLLSVLQMCKIKMCCFFFFNFLIFFYKACNPFFKKKKKRECVNTFMYGRNSVQL